MKLVLIYGPPGAGKLTVAQELQKVTSFKLLHNHLVTDLCETIFEFGTPTRADLNLSIRSTVVEVAAKNGVNGIIFTLSYYAGPQMERANYAMGHFVALMKRIGGEACFVRLSCDQEELEKRVVSPSRIGTKKVTDIAKFKKILREELPCAEIPRNIAESLHIDNTSVSPQDAAIMIQKAYQL